MADKIADEKPDAQSAARQPPTNIAEAIGGPLGMAETALPVVAFTVAYTASGSDTNTAAIVAVCVALVLTIVRLARRESPQYALSGLVGVAFAAFVATRSGKAENFFLPGLFVSAVCAAAFLVSLAVRRPLVGIIVTMIDDGDSGWREDPRRMRAFTWATWLWAALFLSRLLVMLPLYLAGAVVALGVARTAMGLPIIVLGLWLTWLIVRGVRTPAPAGA